MFNAQCGLIRQPHFLSHHHQKISSVSPMSTSQLLPGLLDTRQSVSHIVPLTSRLCIDKCLGTALFIPSETQYYSKIAISLASQKTTKYLVEKFDLSFENEQPKWTLSLDRLTIHVEDTHFSSGSTKHVYKVGLAVLIDRMSIANTLLASFDAIKQCTPQSAFTTLEIVNRTMAFLTTIITSTCRRNSFVNSLSTCARKIFRTCARRIALRRLVRYFFFTLLLICPISHKLHRCRS